MSVSLYKPKHRLDLLTPTARWTVDLFTVVSFYKPRHRAI